MIFTDGLSSIRGVLYEQFHVYSNNYFPKEPAVYKLNCCNFQRDCYKLVIIGSYVMLIAATLLHHPHIPKATTYHYVAIKLRPPPTSIFLQRERERERTI